MVTVASASRVAFSDFDWPREISAVYPGKVSRGTGEMSTFPSSKSFSSTPVKYSNGRELHHRPGVDSLGVVSPDDSTYSLLSPIYHDSFDSDEGDLDAAAGHRGNQIDTSAVQSEDARPFSPIRVELPQNAPERPRTEGEESAASLSAWERWLVCKAKDERLRTERKAEEERLEKEKQEEREREQQRKKMVVEEKIQDWMKMKRQQEKQEKQQRQSRELEQSQIQHQQQREVEQRAEEKYRAWLRRKNQEKTEREKREKEEADRREAQEKERRQRAEETFKEWLASTQDKNRASPKTAGRSTGCHDNTSYPSPGFYNPIPWKPIHVPPPEKPQKKKKTTSSSRRKAPSQSKYQHGPSVPFRPRDTLS